jgi:TolB protein
MKHHFLWPVAIIATVVVLILVTQSDETDPGRAFPGEVHLKNVTQLTFGGTNAEAYFSFDQERLVFQSTRGDLECDQIFTMNLDGSDVRMVSTGKGRTTCAYYLPGDSLILYASTHAASDACPPPIDRSLGYVWKLYDEFDIYLARTDGTIIKTLASSPAYDAEATVSPVGDRIVFTSLRDGDPALYSMNLDGSDLRKLTDRKGYEGGPFYSLDGTQIVYRANYPRNEEELADYERLMADRLLRPMRLEIYIMNADGSNLRQVTDLGAASFAPYFHPDGERIIFSSNYGDPEGRNFNLYIVNTDGTGLKQITYNDTFDSFPVFSYDGSKLVWASGRNARAQREINVFIADWVE